MKLFKKIAIVGVGLIGGSIGLAVKKKRLASEVVGACRRRSSLRKALKFKAVGHATLNLKEAVRGADLVIIAAPVAKITRLVETCVAFMKRGAIITDVGSVKEAVVNKAEKICGRRMNFVGSHPMAGSDKSGVANASADLFKGAVLVLTKTKNTDAKSLARLGMFWKALGCSVFWLSPAKHDERASLASYLPHAVSFALSFSQTDDSLKLAAGSLKSGTRVASSDAELWKDIFLAAKGPVLKSISIFSHNLKILEKAVRKKDTAALKRFLEKARDKRNKIGDGK